MTTDSHAKGLQYWVERLQREQLPVLGRHGRQLVDQLLSPRISLHQLHELLSRDPVLSFYLLNEANRLNRNQDTDIKNLRHAISLIGLGRVQQLIARVPVLQADLQNRRHLQYLQALSNSLHAAEQAYEWVGLKQPSRAEDAYWNTLFFSAANWYLACYAGEALERIEQRMCQGESLAAADRAVLGCTRLEIAQALAPGWHLSDYETEQLCRLYQPPRRQLLRLARLAGMSESVQPADQALARLLHHPYFAPMLANWLALAVNQSWYSRETLRIQRIVAVLLGLPLPRAITRMHQIAVQASHQHPLPGVMLPAAQLLLPVLPPRRRRPVAAITTKPPRVAPASTPPRQVQSAPTGFNPPVLKAFIQQVEQRPEPFADLKSLMQATAHAVRNGLGVERCLLLLKSGQRQQLRSYFAVGYQGLPAMMRLSVPLNPSHLLGRMLGKAASLHIHAGNYQRFAPLLPEAFSNANDTQDFMLMSITAGKQPVGVLLASRPPGQPPLSAQQYAGFKRLCQAMSVGMEQLAQRQREAVKMTQAAAGRAPA